MPQKKRGTTAQATNIGPIPPIIKSSEGIYQGDRWSCTLVEFDHSVFQLVLDNFVIEWFGVE